jgi:DNA-binding MarR family transcriptional regulator
MTPSELRAELFITAGAVTKQIQRLEGKGLILRRAVPTDGRAVTTRLSRAGRKLVDDELLFTDDYVFRAPLDLTPSGRAHLVAELRNLVLLLETHTAATLKRG